MNIDSLRACGLSQREARVYSTLMAHPDVSLSKLAQYAKCSRTETKRTLSALLKHSLAIALPRGTRTHYRAGNPEALRERATGHLEHVVEALPELLEVFRHSSGEPLVTVHDGVAGIRATIKRAVAEAAELRSFSSPSTFFSVLTENDACVFTDILTKRGIQSRSLASNTKENHAVIPQLETPHTSFRLLPKTMRRPTEILMYNNITSITSWQRVFSVTIESPEITRFLEAIFDDMWEQAQTYETA